MDRILHKNLNTQEIINEAVGVHVDGQEPHHTADEYEAALLSIARVDQKPSENIAEAMARIASNGNPEVSALLFAADRVRARDAATVGKSAVALDAERVRKDLGPPRYTRDDYHDGMMEIAKAEALPGEDAVSSFARLCGAGRFDELYAAGEQAEAREVEAVVVKVAPGTDDRFHRALVKLATYERRPGESIEKCYSRLLQEDPTVRAGYAATQEL